MIEVSTDGRVRRIALNRPEKRNALNMAACADLLGALDDAEADSDIGAILITGNGPAFCAGMDLAEVLHADQQALTALHERLFTVIQRARKPIVAGVRGAALAAGFGLAANAHVVVAGPDAGFGLTEIRIGLWPAIVFRSIVLAIGERRATELSLTGRIIGAEEARMFGLVAEAAAEPVARALEISHALAGQSAAAMAAGLDYAIRIRGLIWDEAGVIGHKMRDGLMQTPEFNQGVQSFLETRRTHKQ